MVEYDSGTAVHFVVFAVVFSGVFMFTAWRIVRRIGKSDDDQRKDDERSNDQTDV